MKSFSRRTARAAITLMLLCAAAGGSVSAQRVQDIAPAPATAPATAPVGPRIPAEIPRVEPVLDSRADAPTAVRKDSMHTITISTVALVLLVVIIVLLVA